MTVSSSASGFRPATGFAADQPWRTRDIVVTAIIGVAFGVVFWAWGLAWAAVDPVFAAVPWAKDLLYAVWLIPAVLAPLIVRKPGAALFAELVAAGVSAYLGSQWGVDTLLSGLLQGGAAELVFAMTFYRQWSLPVLGAAAVASAAAAWLHDWVIYYADVAVEIQLLRGLMMAISAVVFVAGGSVLLAGALRQAGVLQGFPGGEVPPTARAG
jgi:energy-coupling factor transport system substrate-specific component